MSYIDYDPKKHKGRQLYEIQTAEDGKTVPVPVGVSYEQAVQTPYYYVVEEEQDV